MRFLVLCTVACVVHAAPTCVCGSGKFYSAASAQATLSGGKYSFLNCTDPPAGSTDCENGHAIGATGISGQGPLPGTITRNCIRKASFSSVGELLDNTITAAGENTTDHKSACCAVCNPGYRLEPLKQNNVFMGYICVPQVCVDGQVIGLSGPPADIKCDCDLPADPKNRGITNSFFRNTFLAEYLAKPQDPQRMNVHVNVVSSAEPLWHEHAGQGECVDFQNVCYKPANCNDTAAVSALNCVKTNQPFATLCTTCNVGYNKDHVKCTDLNAAWVNGTDPDTNKCDRCVLPEVGVNGCTGGFIVS